MTTKKRSTTLMLSSIWLIALLCVYSPRLPVISAAAKCYSEDLACKSTDGSLLEDDPLTRLRIAHPMDGVVLDLPVEIRFHIDAKSYDEFTTYYAEMSLCVELNGQWKQCKTPKGQPIVFRTLPEGNYTAAAFITDKDHHDRYHESKNITFTVLNSREFALRNEELAEKNRLEQQFPKDIDLLYWANLKKKEDYQGNDILGTSSNSHPTLLIGVKTEVVTGFPRRQAIRDTWASPVNLPEDVKVFFLGCEPDPTVFRNELDRSRISKAITTERAIYKDLLTEELECTDSYKGLTDKVTAFMRLATAEIPDAKFVMIADDDIYLKVDQLAGYLRTTADRLKRYFGEVWSEKSAHKLVPNRDSEHRYYLSKDQYPMRDSIPFVNGPHYVISMDGVRFIAKNFWRLNSIHGMDDITVGIWLKTMQIKAQHTPDFSSARASLECEDSLVAFADLSTLGIRSIHANLANNRSFCHGFHSVIWHRYFNILPDLEEMLQRQHSKLGDEALQFETYIDASTPDHVIVIGSTPSNAGIKWSFNTSLTSIEEFCQEICTQVEHLFPVSAACATTLQYQLQLHSL